MHPGRGFRSKKNAVETCQHELFFNKIVDKVFVTLQGTNIFPPQGTFESMIFTFPQVGYVIVAWRVVLWQSCVSVSGSMVAAAIQTCAKNEGKPPFMSELFRMDILRKLPSTYLGKL